MLPEVGVLRVEELHPVRVAEVAKVVILAQMFVQLVLVNPPEDGFKKQAATYF